jgi:hypothetical protein
MPCFPRNHASWITRHFHFWVYAVDLRAYAVDLRVYAVGLRTYAVDLILIPLAYRDCGIVLIIILQSHPSMYSVMCVTSVTLFSFFCRVSLHSKNLRLGLSGRRFFASYAPLLFEKPLPNRNGV